MPHKKNANGRHHIPKMRHCVTNWREYEAGLRWRGSLTMWVTDGAMAAWAAATRATLGGQAVYSDSAIQTCLMLRAAFKLPLRQAEGLMLSVVELLGCRWPFPTTAPSAAGLPSSRRSPAMRCRAGRCTC